jgi:hypothetical protein
MAGTLRDKLEYLVTSTGSAETDILARAVEGGISELYRKEIARRYAAGELDREHAVSELGEEQVRELDYAWEAIEKDVRWGMRLG